MNEGQTLGHTEKCEYDWMGTCDEDAVYIALFESNGFGTFTAKYCEKHGKNLESFGNFISAQKIEILTLQPCPKCNPIEKIMTPHKTKVDYGNAYFECTECGTKWAEKRQLRNT